MVRDHTSKAFEPKAIDHHIVDFCGKNQVLVKDSYGNTKKVHVKDVKPIEMDIATTEFLRKEREQCTTRDAKHVMPIKLIPDLEWEFIENIDGMEFDKGVTIYCVKETENENEATQVTKVSKPEIDVKTTENIKHVVTEAVEASEDTQTTKVTKSVEDTNTTETEQPRYKHRESSETVMEDTAPREITKETEHTENTGISQAVLVDPAEDTETTEVSEHVVPEEVEVTETADTIEITEVATHANYTAIPEEIKAVASRENVQSENCSTNMTTPPGSPQRENPKIQNSSEDTTQVETETEQIARKTHQYPEVNNSLVNKIFSVFRQAKVPNPQPAPKYKLQM